MSRDYEAWAESKFQGGDKAELRAAAEVWAIALPPNCTEAYIRKKLCEAAGKIAPNEETVPNVAVLSPSSEFPEDLPGVNGIGRWGGRRHTVTISAPPGEKTKFVPIGWEGEFLYVKYGVKTHLPEPHYNIIKDAKIRTFTITARTLGNGTKIRHQEDEENDAFSMAYHGVTPGTEHLPGSVQEWYQQLAKKKDYFKRFRTERLEEIYSELWGHPPKEGNHAWTRDKLRREVLRFLGPEYVKAAFRDEIEEDEAA